MELFYIKLKLLKEPYKIKETIFPGGFLVDGVFYSDIGTVYPDRMEYEGNDGRIHQILEIQEITPHEPSISEYLSEWHYGYAFKDWVTMTFLLWSPTTKNEEVNNLIRTLWSVKDKVSPAAIVFPAGGFQKVQEYQAERLGCTPVRGAVDKAWTFQVLGQTFYVLEE